MPNFSELENFRNQSEDEKNKAIWKALNTYIISSLQDFLENSYTDVDFGSLIYDNNYTVLTKFIERDIFLKSFPAIFASFTSPGTYENLITIIKSIFDPQSDVFFEEEFAKLKITITQPKNSVINWINTRAAGGEISDIIDDVYTPDELVFVEQVRLVRMEEIVELFVEYLVPCGIRVEVVVV
jgi:hypothetical protein